MPPPNPPTTIPQVWMFGCAVWFLAIGPIFIGALVAAFIGGVSVAWIGAVVGLLVGVGSFVYGRRVLDAAKEYERKRLAGTAPHPLPPPPQRGEGTPEEERAR